MESKTNKLTIYLIKSEYRNDNDIVEVLREGIIVEGIGTFYSAESYSRPPDWINNFFGEILGNDLGIRTASAKGILLVPIDYDNVRYVFVVSFGFGRFLLKDGVFEERFGLKVVLNVVDPKSLRSIDKTSLGSVPKHSREQIVKEGITADFGIDIEQDLIHSLTGKSKDSKFGKTITGRDALSVAAKVDVNNIKDFLKLCIERYKSNDYKIDFGWIDQITDIRSSKKTEELNNLLLAKLNAGDVDKIWMAVPDVIDWVNIRGFRYIKHTAGDLKDDLDVQDFIAACAGRKMDIDFLKSTLVYEISIQNDEIVNSWSSFDCIYAEIEQGGKVYILNNSMWYEIVKDFTKQVKDEFVNTEEADMDFPDYNHEDEYKYNQAVPLITRDICCMDRKDINHGGGHSRVEFCDLLTKTKTIIHIKRYGGSSQLSHLFSQGVVSGELFAADSGFRLKLNDELPAEYKLNNATIRPNPAEYEVVYGIISKSNKKFDIPFFSKVSLRNAKRRLEGYGYRVRIKKIKNIKIN